MVFYEMLHGRTPWTGIDIENLKANIAKFPLEFKQNLSPAIKSVLGRMLQVDKQYRISWD